MHFGDKSRIALYNENINFFFLGHSNIKLFINSGTYDSLLQTVYHAVPSLMIPTSFDQLKNAFQAKKDGYALIANDNFNEDSLYILIKELLENTKYAENARSRSTLFHDRPLKPLETAVYWIEYIIRHNGADHLKVAANKMSFYQLYMFDVIFVLIVNILFLILSFYAGFRMIFRKKLQPQKLKQK